MVLGQATPNRFETFRRPQDATFYTPNLAPTAFYATGWQPLGLRMLPQAAYRPRLPDLPRGIRPGTLAPSMRAPFPTQPGPAPAMPSAPQQLQGYLGHAPGTSPFDFLETDPSRRMRTGAWMNVPSTSGGIHAGVLQAGALIKRLHPAAFPFATAGGF